MKKSELEKYIGELSPEMQEKARQCKDMKELNALLAENDVELSESALEAVAGGFEVVYFEPEPLPDWICPLCGSQLYFMFEFKGRIVAYCANKSCRSYRTFNWTKKDNQIIRYYPFES